MSSTPSSGYASAGTLTNLVKTQGAQLLKTEAINFASSKIPALSALTGSATVPGGLASTAVNAAIEGARSASDKLNGALGGKGTSVLGSKLAGTMGGSSSLTQQVTNYATGAITQSGSIAQDKLANAMKSRLGATIGGMLGSQLSQLTDSATKNLTAAKLAPGFLETGPKDTLLTTDVYGVSDNGILNNVGQIGGTLMEKFDEIRRSPTLITDLVGMVASGSQGGWAVSKEGLKDRILSSLGGRTGIMSSLASTFQNTINTGNGLPNQIFNTVSAVLGDQNITFSSDKMNTARDIFSMINNVTRGSQASQFFDVAAESSLLSGVMREAIALGIPNTVELLSENAKTDEVAYNALYANMRIAIEYSDLDAVLVMLNQVGVTAFLAQIPDAVSLILQYYKLPQEARQSGYSDDAMQSEWLALKAILDQLDPSWTGTMRAGEAIGTLTPYSNISDDARQLLMRDPDHLVGAIIGDTYSASKGARNELKSNYPLIPFSP